ncbi:MAG TPA: AgmX/PglI C-terminal domain-containing protein [Polyangia bacterium]|nr:AgmX/PglI C-terminal domain-containing protein [Polyangia bacterium]
MKFVCDRCQTKYSIADDKVRGKILKVRCKSCSNIITVREEGGAVAGVRRPSVPAATVGAAVRAPTPATARAPIASGAAPAVERRAAPRPPEQADDGATWYMALDGNRTGPFTRKQLFDHIVPLPRDADLHVWNERLGSWKPPTEVPALAGELAARRRPAPPIPAHAAAIPAPPIPAAPAAPPPFPGAPRRPTAPVAVPAPARQTGAHPVVGSPIAPGAGPKLPPPVAPPGGRRPTGPLAPAGGLAAAAHAPAHAPDPGLDIDPSSMLETPAPQPSMLHGLATNGVSHPEGASHAASNGTSHAAEKSDVLNTLNLASASGAGPAPRLLKSEAVVGWQPAGAEQTGARQKTTRIILALLGVIAAVCVVLVLTVAKKPKQVAAPPPKAVTDPLAGVVDNPPPADTTAKPGPTEAPPPPPPPEPTSSHGGRGKHTGPHGRPIATGPSPTTPPPVGPGTSPPPPADDGNSKYSDKGHNLNITGGTGVSRPPPSQSDITRVIHNNMGGIKNCYQRALLRDSSLTHGKMNITVSIGISGRVKHTAIDGPPQFRSLEPCIKEVVGRWAFPPAGEEYGTAFVYLFQGNE